jgi:cysteine-rich repeat protein
VCFKTPVCGDGVVDTGEECDNGNTSNLDGCDSACNYEVFVRMNSVTIRGGGAGSATDVLAPSFCTHTANGLGNALSNTALDGNFAVDGLNDSLADDIAAGTTNIIVQALGLDDLNGVNDSSLQLGVTTGNPDPARGTWPGSSQIDWWYLLDGSTLDSAGIPTAKITPAAVANRNLSGGPSTITMLLNLGGSVAQLEMLNARVAAATSTATSTPAPPPQPNQLATGLTVFNTIAATGNSQGLCGDVTVESLAQIPVPEVLTSGSGACSASCSNSRAYTYCGSGQPVGPSCNSLLDVLVGGCRAALCILVAAPSQPDVNNGGPSPLTLSQASQSAPFKVQPAQTNGNNNAYSAWFQFTAQRVHATGQY